MDKPKYIRDPAAFITGDELIKLKALLMDIGQHEPYETPADVVGIDACFAQIWGFSPIHGLTADQRDLIYRVHGGIKNKEKDDGQGTGTNRALETDTT